MATLNLMAFDLVTGVSQLISDASLDSSTRKSTLPGALDTGGDIGVTGDITVTGTVDGVDIASRDTVLTNHVAATAAHGATGAVVGTTNTQVMTNKTLTLPQFNDTSGDHQYVLGVSELAADRTITLPLLTGNDEILFADHAKSMTNKSLDLSANTLTGTLAEFNTALSDGDFASLAGAETLTNKSIAGGANTLSGILTSSLASTTGDDTAVATGTAGVASNLVMWDGNGNVVDSTVAVSSLVESIGDLDDVTETSVAAYDILIRNSGNTAWINFAKGNNGEFLTVVGGALDWGVSGAGSMSSFDVGADTGTNQTVTDGVLLDILGDNGMATAVTAGSAIVTISLVPDVTTGTTRAPLLVAANGVSVGVDDATIDHSSGTIGVKDGGIGGTQIATALTKSFVGGVVDFAAPGELLMVGSSFSGTQVPNADWVLEVAQGLTAKAAVIAGTFGLLLDNASITGTPTYNPLTNTDGQIAATLGVSGVFTVDGQAMTTGDRVAILVEEEGTPQVSSVTTRADVSSDLNNDYFVMYFTPNQAVYVWNNVGAAGTDPTPSAPAGVTYTGIEVSFSPDASADAVASAIDAELNTFVYKSYLPFVCQVVTNELTITNIWGGLCTDVAEGVGTGFTFGTDTPGTGLGAGANGIWIVTIVTTALTMVRSDDFNSQPIDEVVPGSWTFVTQGTENHDTSYVMTTHPATVVPGTAAGDVILWTIFQRAGDITASTGLVKVGSDIRIKPDVTTGATHCYLTAVSNGASVQVDNDTIGHSSGVLSVQANSIGPNEVELGGSYSWSGTQNFGASTLTLPNTWSTDLGNTFTIIDETDIAMSKYASMLIENLDNATAGGVLLGDIVSLITAGTLSKSDANTPAHGDGFVGIVQANAAGGAPVKVTKKGRAVLLMVAFMTGMALGEPVYMSNATPGSGTGTISGYSAGDVVKRVGTLVDKLSYDGITDMYMQIEVQDFAPIVIA